ncbi:hypothetical protein TrVFT333_009807 [Trichoderma virens FT-333]|nr:hypothetical protein TrVFT333_009807 [Trichoderma virens FT-333]
MRGSILAETCDEMLLASLAHLEGPLREEMKDVHTHLEAIGRLLRAVQPLEGRHWVQAILQECRHILNQLCATAYSPSSYQDSITEQISDLADVRNALSLALNLNLSIENDELKDETMVKTIKQGLDTISTTLMAAVDEIMPTTLTASNKGTFRLREAILAVNGNWDNSSSTHDIICPNCFLHERSPSTSIMKLKFGCDCPATEASHDSELEYQALPATFLVEQIRPGQEREWHMVLYKPRSSAIVSIIVSGVPAMRTGEIDTLAQDLADQFSKNLATEPRNKELVFTGGLVYRLMSVSPPEAFVNRLPSQLEFKLSNSIIKLAWQPRRVQLRHYSSAFRPHNMSDLKSLEFLPSPEFEIQISKDSREANNEDFSIFVLRDSVVIDGATRERSSWVTLSKVGMRQGGVTLEVSEINFGFDRKQDAVNWKFYVEAIRERLRQLYAQSSFAFESEIYHQESATLLRRSSHESPRDQDISISVICSKFGASPQEKMRMVVKRNSRSDSVCLDFDSSILKIAQRGLTGSLDLISFLTYDTGGPNGPVVEQTNWKKLTSRGKNRKPPQPLSMSGPQVLRERRVSSEEWLDKIDELKSAMDASSSTKGEYNPVKVCVIDTGFNPAVRGYKKVKAFKDFVEPNSTSIRDNTWHGTISASIILSIHENCELYVARIFESDDTDDETGPELMAQAIEWSISPDINVDIISISAGFLYHSPRLQDAVQKASGANKLILAAASNWGNLGPVAFPARHNLYTICIFSTDTHNRASEFNPERRPDAHNFAILGEDFQHPGYSDQRVRGTSTATAAAAGLAALIIDFSRHKDNCQSIVRVADVSKMLGMVAIFNFLSERAGEFKCIMPLKLLPSDYHEMDRQKKREYIRQSLSRAMDQAN